MYLIFIPFAQNSSLASWIFNGTISIFNPFKAWHEAGNWIILTKLSPAKRHQAAHEPYPFVHNWEGRQHASTLPPRKPSGLPGVRGQNRFHKFLGITPTYCKGGNSPRNKLSGICKHNFAFIQDSPPRCGVPVRLGGTGTWRTRPLLII